MTRYSGLALAVVLAVLVVGQSLAWATTSIDVSLVNPGSSTVSSGTPVELQIVGTFDAALTATAYTISVTQDSNDAGGHLNARSADPNDPDNGLAYISRTSQLPFWNGLAHNFAIEDAPEVLMDLAFGGEPGGPYDGVDPNTDVMIERIWITPTGTGSLTVTLSAFSAVTMPTQGDPNGAFFDTMTITQDEVSLTVQSPAYYWLETETHGGGEIDLDPEPNDANVPVYEGGTEVTLTGEPGLLDDFQYWHLLDPNYPGDGNYFEEDSNDPIVVAMDFDRKVEAYFACSGSSGMAMVLVCLGMCRLVASHRPRRIDRSGPGDP